MDEKQIVQNIKRIRQNKKMPLERLAKLCGLKKGYVSKIENSDKAPPFSTISRIADGLDTDIGLLIDENLEVPEDINLCIVRKDERKEVMSRGTLYGYHYEAWPTRRSERIWNHILSNRLFTKRAPFPMMGKSSCKSLKGDTNLCMITESTF
jgi:transcriptional regulator with XRE-family HTH domain